MTLAQQQGLFQACQLARQRQSSPSEVRIGQKLTVWHRAVATILTRTCKMVPKTISVHSNVMISKCGQQIWLESMPLTCINKQAYSEDTAELNLTSPGPGGATVTIRTSSGFLASHAIAALHSIGLPKVSDILATAYIVTLRLITEPSLAVSCLQARLGKCRLNCGQLSTDCI